MKCNDMTLTGSGLLELPAIDPTRRLALVAILLNEIKWVKWGTRGPKQPPRFGRCRISSVHCQALVS